MSTKKNKQVDSVLCGSLSLKKPWPKLGPRDADSILAGNGLDSGPVLRIGHGAPDQPVTDVLLAESGSLHELSNLGSERGLTSCGCDEPLQGVDVRFIHGRHSTNILVDVNKNSDSITDKGFCNVLDMQLARKRLAPATPARAKKAKKTRKARALEVGRDGLTMPERLRSLMLDHKPPFVPERGGQTHLAKAAQLVYANGREHAPATIKQAHIWEMLNGQDSSRYLPVVAKVLGVNCLWLQFGIGDKYAH